MIKSLLLVDDEELFHLVFEDACSILDIAITVESINSTDEAEELFKEWHEDNDFNSRPECVFVDLNMTGSTFDGITLIDKINHKYGNNVVIGIISSSNNKDEIEQAKRAGAQFWIIKTHDLEPRLLEFIKDYNGFKERTGEFKIYE